MIVYWIVNLGALSGSKLLRKGLAFRRTSSGFEIRFPLSERGTMPIEKEVENAIARSERTRRRSIAIPVRKVFSFMGSARPGNWLILCDRSERITAIGQINGRTMWKKQAVVISVVWHSQSRISNAGRSVIRKTALVERLSDQEIMRKRLKAPLKLYPGKFLNSLDDRGKMKMALKELMLPAASIGERPAGTMSKPLTYPSGAYDEISQESVLLGDPGEVIDLFYATSRTNSGDPDINARYTGDYGALLYGICRVNIPPGHVRGELERPKWWKARFQESEKRDVMLVELDQLDAPAFFSAFSNRLGEREGKEALLFIHGYNVEFRECAWRTGQIAHDLSFPGVSAFYSWPSSGNVRGYPHDEQIARNCIPHLQGFIKSILQMPGIEKLHLITHSMGTYILTNSLKNLVDDATIKKELDLIHQVILCAPDIDKTEFEDQIYPKFVSLNSRRTVYASDKDEALKVSQAIRQGLPRLGESGSNLFVAPGIDTVDATNVRTDLLGHGYFASARALILDIYNLVRNELEPKRRNLAPRTAKGGLTYWLFPE
ncbi:alpha/beta hydrolase [bacterium]|nr:MAG: alpha/beta hydrolase [bacterium]